ncbi:MAG: CHRD domain-containing protein [Verrucomicrobia bacterium]|nr:CHRD domain-containing protein [Verrucomicrobiota bacterium]
MKQLLALTLLAGGLIGAFAQGTFQFAANLSGLNEIPPIVGFAPGSVTFTLMGNSLEYSVGMQPATYPSGAGVFGPASPGQTGPLQFDLAFWGMVAPGPSGEPGGVYYLGTILLTPEQISDLQNGLWYVNIMRSDFPDGLVRGQIMPVPEPSALGLAVVGLALWLLSRKRVPGQTQGFIH